MTKGEDILKSRKVIEEFVIPKCSSKAFSVKKGQVLRVIAHEGKQVADIRFLNANDYKEEASPIFSAGLNWLEGIGGDKKLKKIYSKPPWENVMVTVIDDKAGHHWFNGCCSPKHREFYRKFQDEELLSSEDKTCAELFDECLKPYHISMRDLDWAGVFNLWMVARFDENGNLVFDRPSCEKGDYIDFLAEGDLLVAATSCPNTNIINDFEPKALKYQVLE